MVISSRLRFPEPSSAARDLWSAFAAFEVHHRRHELLVLGSVNV
jgi:hypothetical protein